MTQFILGNKETINTLFLDVDDRGSMTVFSIDDLYHQIQRIADTVRIETPFCTDCLIQV